MRTSSLVCLLTLVSACGQIGPSSSGLKHQWGPGHGHENGSDAGAGNGGGVDTDIDTDIDTGTDATDIGSLVPAIGFPSGDPNSTEDHVGPNGVLIPGRCPPSQDSVNQQVAQKNPDFPRGTDLESRIKRFEMALSAIQELDCPASSTTLLERLKSLTALRSDPNKDSIVQGLGYNETPADKPAEPVDPTPDVNGLVPAIGFPAGDPNSTQDHLGPNGVLIPGRCPPSQEAVNAQVALKNPDFPSGTDLESRIVRFEKTLAAIQDLQCPASSTTLLGRLKSLTALRGDPNVEAILQGLDFNATPAG